MPGSPVRTYADIPGWFRWVDKTMFEALLRAQRDRGPGDLVELGVYLGKSAVVVGAHVREGERLVVVDLFGADPGDFEPSRAGHEANRRENQRSYASLDRDRFEANYLALHEQLPTVVTGPSRAVVEHVAASSARFVHVDAGHLYDDVHADLLNARTVLQPGGVVVFDDYRSEHTPGVAAAVWGAVATDDLRPFALSANKLYATFGGAGDEPGAVEAYVAALEELVRDDARYSTEVQSVAGRRVLRIGLREAPPKPPATVAELQKMAGEVVAAVLAGPSRPAA